MILHGESFGYVAPSVHRARTFVSHRSKRCAPVTVDIFATHVLRLLVVKVLVAHGAVEEVVILLLLAQLLGCHSDGIVVVGILQSL